MSIKIITDSAADINHNELENVIVVPVTVAFDDVQYKDGVDLTKDEFYQKLESSERIPVTSLPGPMDFQQHYQALTEQGDEAIVITISGELSGTYQSAMLAAEDYPNISVIDSRQVTAAQRILVMRALDLIRMGKTRAEIVDKLEEEKKRIRLFASVATLKYLEKGGRISKGTAIIGGLIGIKPILTLVDGKLENIGKARGSKQAAKFLNAKLEEAGGIDFDLPYLAGYSGTDPATLLSYIEDNQHLISDSPHPIGYIQVGSAVGTHAGPGAIVVCFFGRNECNTDAHVVKCL